MVHTNVEKIREAKGVTKTRLAEALGLSLQGYRHIANGNTRLDVERLRVIARVLGEPIEVFLDDKLTETVISKLQRSA